MPGAFGCTGAKEFWAGYDWPWNKYHELNVDFCRDSKNPVLVPRLAPAAHSLMQELLKL